MNLAIKEEQLGNKTQVFLSGEVDAYTAPKLREVLIPIAEEANREITVNLENVSYIDSTGLGVFIGALKATDAHNSSIKLVGVTKRILRLFEITGLDEVMDIEKEETGGVR